MFKYIPGDIVYLLDEDYTVAVVKSVNDDSLSVETFQGLLIKSWETKDVRLLERSLAIGQTYYVVTKNNIVTYKVASSTPAGETFFYEGEKSIAGGPFRPCDHFEIAGDLFVKNKVFNLESDANDELADSFTDEIEKLKEKITSLLRSASYHKKIAKKLRKKGK